MSTPKFVLIDADAAEDIVSTRTLQSDEFEQGQLLAASITGAGNDRQLAPRTFLIREASGLFILNDRNTHKDFLVIDLESAPIFADCSSRDVIVRFQKLLRFSRRRWARVSPAQNEKILPNSTKAVVFPYPITTHSSIRISIELSPDQHRRERRKAGIELLAYRIGIDEGGGPHEEASVTNFRRALAELPGAINVLNDRRRVVDAGAAPQIDSLAVTRLNPGVIRGVIEGCNFDEWQEYLTETQRNFIRAPLDSPHRIEGPAGTGKTLSLVLKCIAQLRDARAQGAEHRALFVAHSEATRRAIQSMFDPDLLGGGLLPPAEFSLQTLKVTTLHELCGELLRYEISDSELLDKDAFESKQSQLLYAVEAMQEALRDDLSSHRPHMSPAFLEFLEKTDEWIVAEIFQHEISVMIKGRAGEDLEKYKRLPALSYGLPVKNEGDKAFAFLVFNGYQRKLRTSGQFDTDDVVLSALQQLDTPIWRRRREREGYDGIYVDETHLFNINELSVFHRLTRRVDNFPIAYSADISQSLGDRGWSHADIGLAVTGSGPQNAEGSAETRFTAIFRCSPEIVNLAFSVTSSGATLFTNFDDPLKAAASAFTEAEERKCAQPEYALLSDDEAMIQEAFRVADQFVEEMSCTRGDVAIVAFGDTLFGELRKAAEESNKPIELVKHRGDFDVVRRARSSGRYVLSAPDFVGGLEFYGVILVGVDKGRVPPKVSQESFDSANFVSYASHQRLYVAITRARFRITILGLKVRGVSDLLSSAVANNMVLVR